MIEKMSNIPEDDCQHENCVYGLGKQGKGISQWCRDCGAYNPGEGCDWQIPRADETTRRYKLRSSKERRAAYDLINTLQLNLKRKCIENNDLLMRATEYENRLRRHNLMMSDGETESDEADWHKSRYDTAQNKYEVMVEKLTAEPVERGHKNKRQSEQIKRLQSDRDDAVMMRDAARCELTELRRERNKHVHEIKDMEAELRNFRAKEAHYLDLIGSVWMVLNGESNAHKIHDAS
jgi:hypothetical protein